MLFQLLDCSGWISIATYRWTMDDWRLVGWRAAGLVSESISWRVVRLLPSKRGPCGFSSGMPNGSHKTIKIGIYPINTGVQSYSLHSWQRIWDSLWLKLLSMSILLNAWWIERCGTSPLPFVECIGSACFTHGAGTFCVSDHCYSQSVGSSALHAPS